MDSFGKFFEDRVIQACVHRYAQPRRSGRNSRWPNCADVEAFLLKFDGNGPGTIVVAENNRNDLRFLRAGIDAAFCESSAQSPAEFLHPLPAFRFVFNY